MSDTEVQAVTPEPQETTKPSLAQRLLRIFSILSIVTGALTLVLFVLLGIIGMSVPTEELAEALDTSADAAQFAMIVQFVLAGIACIVSIVQGIIGLRVKKRPELIWKFILIAGVIAGVEGIQVIWGIASGDYGDVGTIVGALLGIAYDVLVVVVGFQVAREVDGDKAARAERKAERKRNKLGALGGLQFAYAANIVFTFLSLIFTARDYAVYDYDNITAWITVVAQAVCFYLIWKRLRIARPLVIGITAFAIAVRTVSMILMGTFSPLSFLFGNIFDIGMLVYMLVAERPKRLLVNELSYDLRTDASGEDYIAKSGWPMWRNLLLYYCVFSVLGHWMELAFCMLIRAGLVGGDYDPTNTMLWRDLLFPFPMEGIAVVICALWLYPFKNWLIEKIQKPVIPLVISFVTNALLCSCIEFIGGITFNAHYQHWNYSDMPFNFMGQVCLQNAIGFGVACTLIVWIIYPAMERAISRIPDEVMNLIFVGAFTFNFGLQMLYLVDPTKFAPGLFGGEVASFVPVLRCLRR